MKGSVQSESRREMSVTTVAKGDIWLWWGLRGRATVIGDR